MTYSGTVTAMHRVDPRVKIVLLAAYSITLFCVRTWTGLGLCALAFAVCAAMAKLRMGTCACQLLPLWVVLAVTLAVNSLSLDVTSAAAPGGLGAVSAGVLQGARPIALAGSFGIVPQGFARGCFYVLRIALLAFASVVITTTTSSTELAQSLEQFLKPLARMGVPTRDAATIVSIALRFIPVTFDEFQMVKAAQQSRGAAFATGTVFERVRSWQAVFIPMFVGLFRRADTLATAMDARCYGLANPTSLRDARFNLKSAMQTIVGIAACVLVSVAL